MKLALVLLVATLAVVYSAPSNAHPKHGEFLNWMAKHNKRYGNQAEHDLRFNNYLMSIEKVAELNQNTHNVTYGLNNLADLSSAEFKQRLGYKPRSAASLRNIPHLPPADISQAPQSFDWCLTSGKCTPIKDQGQCGSCWAFATTENIESVWAIGGNGLPTLAPQQIVDCDTGEQGCSGGDPQQAYQYVVSQGGLDTAASYPYTGEDGTCAFSASNVGAKISGEAQGFGSSEAQMAANLASTAPFSIIVDASQWQYYTGGILPASSCGSSLDHAVIAAGYSLNNYWNVRNSWGASWGENGYIRLQFGQNTCGMTTEVLTSTL